MKKAGILGLIITIIVLVPVVSVSTGTTQITEQKHTILKSRLKVNVKPGKMIPASPMSTIITHSLDTATMVLRKSSLLIASYHAHSRCTLISKSVIMTNANK